MVLFGNQPINTNPIAFVDEPNLALMLCVIVRASHESTQISRITRLLGFNESVSRERVSDLAVLSSSVGFVTRLIFAIYGHRIMRLVTAKNLAPIYF